jgi:hypothetical protein
MAAPYCGAYWLAINSTADACTMFRCARLNMGSPVLAFSPDGTQEVKRIQIPTGSYHPLLLH